MPANNKVIVTVVYNTSHFGPNPIGSAACNGTSAGCPYDSLNISVDGTGSAGLAGGLGSLLDPNGIFVNYTLSYSACSGNNVTGTLALDTGAGCWTNNHPQISVAVNSNGTAGGKKIKP